MKLTKAQQKMVDYMKDIENKLNKKVYYRYIEHTKKVRALTIAEANGMFDIHDQVGSSNVALKLLSLGILKESEIPYAPVSNF